MSFVKFNFKTNWTPVVIKYNGIYKVTVLKMIINWKNLRNKIRFKTYYCLFFRVKYANVIFDFF
jgi:hypothetical protein